MKVSELGSILSRLDQDGEIGIERSRQTDIPGVIEVELYELGIKKHAHANGSGTHVRDTYLLYATTKAAAPIADDAAESYSENGSRRRRPVLESPLPLAPVVADDGS